MRREHLMVGADRYHDMTTGIEDVDLARIVTEGRNDEEKIASYTVMCGKSNGGAPAVFERHGKEIPKHYAGTDFDVLIGNNTKTDAAIHDQVFADLVTDGLLNPGTPQDYSF